MTFARRTLRAFFKTTHGCGRLQSLSASFSAFRLPQRSFGYALGAFTCAASPKGFSHALASRVVLKNALWVLLLCTAAGFGLLAPKAANARDMQGRLGIGYNAEFVNSLLDRRVPGISLKYGLTRDIAAEVIAGISTQSPSNTVTGIKLFKNVFYETNLNFYFMLGGAILNANGRSGAEFLGGLGTEFFIPGLESLGFAVETGGSFDNLSGSFVLRTLGVSFLDAGIHFYF